MTVQNNKDKIVIAYIKLSKKLGKLASYDQCTKFSLIKTILYHYSKFSAFQEHCLKLHPSLKSLQSPAKLQMQDLDFFRMDTEVKETKKGNKKLVENVSTLDYIAQFASTVFSGKVKPVEYSKSKKPIQRVHTLVLSDLHFGSNIEGEETGVINYGITEEARRFAYVIREASSYKCQYRDVTTLKILLLGDIIENQMHDPRTGATIAEQVARAIHLLIQGVAYLATKYNTVEVECSTGNHGRNTSRHKERAIHQKWDSLETIVYYAVKESLSNLKNVKVNIPKAPLSFYTVFGDKIAYTHGDTALNPGNPGQALNIRSLENQVNKINAALPDKEEFAAFVYGHTHVPHTVFLNNGSVLIGNGSLPPPDPFAVSIGIYESPNGQWIFESVKDHPVGDMRLIRVHKKYDKDESLDKIIRPWKSF